MKTKTLALVALVAVCVLVVSAVPRAGQAQLQPTADGAALERKARNALQALISLAPSSVWNELAPWHQNSVALNKARLLKALELEKIDWEDVSQGLTQMDPAGKVAMTSADDLRNLSESEFFGLTAGIYRLAANKEGSAALRSEWFLVERGVGIGQAMNPRSARSSGMEMLLQTMGFARFETVEGATVAVTCVAEGKEWYITDVSWKVGKGRDASGSTRQAGAEEGMFAGGVSHLSPGPGAEEAEMMLGTMKNRLKVHYAKHNKIPDNLSDAGVEEEDRMGKYHTVQEKVWSKGDVFILAAHPNKRGGSYALIKCSMLHPSMDTVVHVSTEAEMKTHIEKTLNGESAGEDERDDGGTSAPKRE